MRSGQVKSMDLTHVTSSVVRIVNGAAADALHPTEGQSPAEIQQTDVTLPLERVKTPQDLSSADIPPVATTPPVTPGQDSAAGSNKTPAFLDVTTPKTKKAR